MMKFAFIVYDGVTLLDFAGVYDPVTRLKTMGFVEDMACDVCARKHTVRTFEGVELKADKMPDSLEDYDYLFIPGGNGVAALFGDKAFMGWIKSVSQSATLTAVCGGTLVLGTAGFLSGKRATTHPALMPYLIRLTQFPLDERIVDEGNVITARGVTSAMDLGLYLCRELSSQMQHN